MRWLEPRRLDELSDGDATELGKAIQQLRGMDGDPASVETVRGLVEAALTGGSAPEASTGGLPLAKLGAGLIALGVIAAVAFISYPAAERSTRVPSSPAAVAPRPKLPTRPAHQAQVAQAQEAKPVAHEAHRPAARADRPAPARGKQSNPRGSATQKRRTPQAELSLLRRAQVALDRRPDRSLKLLEEHARDYPEGLFQQEREILWMEAQLKLGNRAKVYPRAKRFMQHHPRSPHRRRVGALLESKVTAPRTDAPE